jgi:hypothetical protein
MKVLDRPASERCYAVAGRFLFVKVSDDRLSRVVSKLFGGWSLEPLAFIPDETDAAIHFVLEPAPPAIPAGWSNFETAGGGCCYTDGDSYYLDFANSLILVEPAETRSITVWFKSLESVSEMELSQATSFAVCAVLRRNNLFELHAAGVVSPETERATLIIGPSGSGKSTLALNLVLSGWNYLSDDELLLDYVAGEVQARGFRRFFAVSNAARLASGLSGLGDYAQSEPESSRKTRFEPSAVLPVREVAYSIPDRLLFTRVTGERESSLIELTPIEGASRLIRACPWATYDRAVAKNYLRILSQLARQSRTFELKAGTDLLDSQTATELLCTNKASLK